MRVFWINLEVNFSSSIHIVDDNNLPVGQSAIGFLQEIGCSADDEEELTQIIKCELSKLDWLDLDNSYVNFYRVGEIVQSEIASEIYADPDIREALIADPNKKGIWYISGKAFFSDNDESDEIFKAKIEKNKALDD